MVNIENAYLDWMYDLVCVDQRRSYRNLIEYLHTIPFDYILPMDGNRAEDGVELRYIFGRAEGYSQVKIARYLDYKDCSVLEMMVALARRCEDQIMWNPEYGDRTHQWFWIMIENLRLEDMDDAFFDEEYVDHVIERMLNRDYGRTGEGGLFVVDGRFDMREMEIWDQMCAYMNQI